MRKEKKRIIMIASIVFVVILGTWVLRLASREFPSSILDIPLSKAIGTRLPDTATEVKHIQLDVFGVHHIYIVAKLPREDFLNLVKKLGLMRDSELIKKRRSLFSSPVDRDISDWWTFSNTPNDDTYYIEGLDEPSHTYIVAMTYENGKMFFRRTDD